MKTNYTMSFFLLIIFNLLIGCAVNSESDVNASHKNTNLPREIPSSPLRHFFSQHNKKIGGKFDHFLLPSQNQNRIQGNHHSEIFAQEYNALTATFFWTWDIHGKSRHEYTWEKVDPILDWAKLNNLPIHGHALVYAGVDEPQWLKTQPPHEVEKIMGEHIDTVLTHVKDQVAVWDVVNEAVVDHRVEDVNDLNQLLKDNLFKRSMGTENGISYVDKAFWKTDWHMKNTWKKPAALIYNDYDMERSDGVKFDNVMALIKRLKKNSSGITGLGWQMHVTVDQVLEKDFFLTLVQRMNQVADLGLDNYITELDIIPSSEFGKFWHKTAHTDDLNTATKNSLIASWFESTYGDQASVRKHEFLEKQRRAYKIISDAFLQAKRTQWMLFWGFTDKHTGYYWGPEFFGHIFDHNLKKKPAYDGIQDALILSSREKKIVNRWGQLALSASSAEENSPVQAQTYNSSFWSQLWHFEVVDSGEYLYRIKNKWTNLYLGTGASPDGTVLRQFNDSCDIIWKLEKVEKNIYRMGSHCNSQLLHNTSQTKQTQVKTLNRDNSWWSQMWLID